MKTKLTRAELEEKVVYAEKKAHLFMIALSSLDKGPDATATWKDPEGYGETTLKLYRSKSAHGGIVVSEWVCVGNAQPMVDVCYAEDEFRRIGTCAIRLEEAVALGDLRFAHSMIVHGGRRLSFGK